VWSKSNERLLVSTYWSANQLVVNVSGKGGNYSVFLSAACFTLAGMICGTKQSE
jgi:hypothetical protein